MPIESPGNCIVACVWKKIGLVSDEHQIFRFVDFDFDFDFDFDDVVWADGDRRQNTEGRDGGQHPSDSADDARDHEAVGELLLPVRRRR